MPMAVRTIRLRCVLLQDRGGAWHALLRSQSAHRNEAAQQAGCCQQGPMLPPARIVQRGPAYTGFSDMRLFELEAVRVDRHVTTHGVSYAIRTIFSPFFVSENSAALPRSRTGAMSTHYVSVLSITQRRLHLGILRTTHHVSAYYVSSAESPPEKAMYYALRIRIMYQEPKAAGEGYLLRITYPH